MGKFLLVVALAACGPVQQAHRWPDHRKQHDAQLEELKQHTQELEQRVLRLEEQLFRLQKASAVPSPGT